MRHDIIEQVLFQLGTRSIHFKGGRERRLRLRGSDSEDYRQTIETLATKLLEALRRASTPSKADISPVSPVQASVMHGADQPRWDETRSEIGIAKCARPGDMEGSGPVPGWLGSLICDPCVWDINFRDRRDVNCHGITLARVMPSWFLARPDEITTLNFSERTAMEATEIRRSTSNPDERPMAPPLRPSVFMDIHSSVVGDDVLHFVTLADGSTDEDWGPKGIERLLERHLNDDRRLLHPDFARHFFGVIDAIMTGEYTITVDVTTESDIENIRITRSGQATAHYRHRFDLFESGEWWLA